MPPTRPSHVRARPAAAGSPSGDLRDAIHRYVLLTVDGRELRLDAERETSIELDGRTLRITAHVPASQRFDDGCLRFDFPLEYAATVGSAPECDQWTLDGGDCVLMLHRVKSGVTADQLARGLAASMTQQFADAGKVRRGVGALRLGKRQRRTIRLGIEILGTRMRQDIVAIRAARASYVLLVQIAMEDSGAPGVEAKAVLAMLEATMRIAEP